MEYDRVPYMQDYLAEHGLYWPLYVVAIYALVILGGRRLMRVRSSILSIFLYTLRLMRVR